MRSNRFRRRNPENKNYQRKFFMANRADALCSISEPARELFINHVYDVVVAGGGIAGIAAAVAAARNGASVCILEKTCALGGLATLGNVTIWLPICDGMGHQVSAGIAEEMLNLSVEDILVDHVPARFCRPPECWRSEASVEERRKARFRADFNPSSYLLALEKWAVDEGVEILYDTRVCSLHVDQDRVNHLIIENKSGRSAIGCTVAIDATGDADLCHLAGETTESLDSNVLSGWFYYLDAGVLTLHRTSNRYSPDASRMGATGPFFCGDNADDVTAQILGTRDLIRAQFDEVRSRAEGRDVQLINPPTIPCFRMTRRLVGMFSLGGKNVHQWFDDTVGLVGDWRKPGPVYAIPYRTLFGEKIHNLLAIGRCMSADTSVWDVTRAIPGCAVTGEAAGTAAALSISRTRGDVRELPVDMLQDQLRSQGVLLDPNLLQPTH
jgi:hypothetical protein